MKKVWAIALVMLCTVFGAAAEEWEIFTFGFTEDIPSDSATTRVCGFRVGVPICGGEAPVQGVEAAVLWGGSKKVEGVKCSIIGTKGDEVTGLQLAIVNFARKVSGLQLGVFNDAKESAFQIGILNHIEKGLIPWMPVINVKF